LFILSPFSLILWLLSFLLSPFSFARGEYLHVCCDDRSGIVAVLVRPFLHLTGLAKRRRMTG
jgi:hypothetical protein